MVAAGSQLRPGLSPSDVSDLELVPALPEDGGVDSAEPEEKRRRVEPEAAAEAAAEGEAEESAEVRRVVPTAEEEEAMGQDIETYLRERQVLGTPAERLIRLEYVEWAKRLVAGGRGRRGTSRRKASSGKEGAVQADATGVEGASTYAPSLSGLVPRLRGRQMRGRSAPSKR